MEAKENFRPVRNAKKNGFNMKQLTKEQLEAISLINDGNYNFFAKLMYMIRSGQVSISEPNLRIYKKVIGAIAKDDIESAAKRKERFEDLML